MNLSDNELLAELTLRFEKNRQTLIEQNELMTQLRQVNDKLLSSEKLKSNFLSNIRNEINNPIASVLEIAKTLSQETLNESSVKKLAALIHQETFQLDFQLRNIFATAEIEAGETNVSVSAANLDSILQGTIASFRHQFAKKNILLTFTSQLNGILFHTDPEKLRLIISNTLSNAIQFNQPSGGTIHVSAEIENGEVKICIKDNGIGVSASNIHFIFDRFRQGEEGSIKSFAGHGLGLSLVKTLLEIINGRLIFESEPGNGTTVTMWINPTEGNDATDEVFSLDGNDFLYNNDCIAL